MRSLDQTSPRDRVVEMGSGDESEGLIWSALGGAKQSDPLFITSYGFRHLEFSSPWGAFNTNIPQTLQ